MYLIDTDHTWAFNAMLMVRPITVLLFFICLNNQLIAQKSNAEKKPGTITTGPNPGFKKQSPSPSAAEKTTSSPNPTQVQAGAAKTIADKQHIKVADATETAKAAQIVSLDYRNMPQEVQSRVNINKTQGKYLLDGIAKSFLVEINSCLTDADQKKTLSFLKTTKGFINSQFIAPGRVRIIVEPSFESAELKDVMAAKGIHFNFLNRSYLLKN